MKEIDAAIEALDALVCSAELAGYNYGFNNHWHKLSDKGAAAIAGLRSLKEREPVAYDKTEMNAFVQNLYDQKMREGRHGHYETMFHVVHQAIKRVHPAPEAEAKELTCGWVQACDLEMVGAHLGVANTSDSFASAKNKLNTLIAWHIEVATNPAVNGGLRLQPAPEQTKQVLENFDELKAQNAQLLEALKKVVAVNHHDFRGHDIARAAIAQVEGKV